jgi:hypothetical protein
MYMCVGVYACVYIGMFVCIYMYVDLFAFFIVYRGKINYLLSTEVCVEKNT